MIMAGVGIIGGIQSARSSSGQGPQNGTANLQAKRRVQLQSFGGMVPPMQLLSAGDDRNNYEGSLESGVGRQLSGGNLICIPSTNYINSNGNSQKNKSGVTVKNDQQD